MFKSTVMSSLVRHKRIHSWNILPEKQSMRDKKVIEHQSVISINKLWKKENRHSSSTTKGKNYNFTTINLV